MSSLLAMFADQDPDVDLGVGQARLLGARYIVVAGVPEYIRRLAPAGVREIARDSLWRLYEIQDFAIALHPTRIETVTRREFGRQASRWFEAGGRSAVPVEVADSPLADIVAETSRIVAGESEIELKPREIRLGGVTPGRPLLLRLSFFPNWTLDTPGHGPFRAAPNHMLVVSDTDEVRLTWQYGWFERVGLWASVVGAGMIVLLALRGRTAVPPSEGPWTDRPKNS